MDIKENLAKNLILYRKAINLTQAELAEKLNYSDKAVSKWERGEAVPDLTVLKQIADFYNVKIDTLIALPKEDKLKFYKNLPKKRFILCSIAVVIVWLIAILCYDFINIIFPVFKETWLFFIYAIPITFFVLFILTSVWKKSFTNMIVKSITVWTIILTVYLSLITLNDNPSSNLWELFLIGIPIQGLFVFLHLYKRVNKKYKVKK